MNKAEDQIQNQATGKQRYYHPQQKDYATFLETSEESGGERTLIEVEVAPRTAAPLLTTSKML